MLASGLGLLLEVHPLAGAEAPRPPDFVVVVNAEKVKVTGRKAEQKTYARHSGEPGGFRSETFEKVIVRKPEVPITKAVKGMLPKNILGRQLITKLKVYAGPDHPHAAQKPELLK